MSDSSAFTREKGEDGVLVLTLDVPGEKVNTLGKGLIAGFEQLLAEIEKDPQIRAVVIRSGKPDNFIAGADIEDFTQIRSAEEGEALSRTGHAIFDRIEASRVPFVAAIHGTCLGGGTELALACRYRVASDDPKTALGLPEVMLGLLPGAGGSQRLPRLVGLATALDLILTGRSLKAKKALEGGSRRRGVPGARPARRGAARGARAWRSGGLHAEAPGHRLARAAAAPGDLLEGARVGAEEDGRPLPGAARGDRGRAAGHATTLAEGLKLEAAAFGRLSASDGLAQPRVSLLRHAGDQEGRGLSRGHAARPRSASSASSGPG